MSSSTESITLWLKNLREGDEEAAARLWDRCFEDLTHMARRRFGAAPKRVHDEEDAAISVFESLCRGAVEGRLQRLETRNDLWPLLVTMTQQKVVDRIRLQTRQKRGGGEVRGDSVLEPARSDSEADRLGFDGVASEDPQPDFLVALDDQLHAVMQKLPDETTRQVALLRLEGFTNQEIGDRLEVSEAAVRRKLRLIRATWEQSDAE